MRTHRPRRGALSSARRQRTGGRGLHSPVDTCLWRLLSIHAARWYSRKVLRCFAGRT